MKHPSAFRIILLISLFCLYSCNNEKRPGRLPNIILVMADDQGWGDIGYNGHPVLQTPAFDSMASEGIRFDRFYAAAPVCSPTRGSVMTGRHPNRFECFSWGYTLRPQETTIAEVLRDAGYVTGHFGKWHLGSVRPGSPVNPGNSGFDEWLSAPNFFDNDPILSREGIAVETSGESSMVTVDAALEFIRRYEGRRKPYFAVIWFGSPHFPHQALERDWEPYTDQPEEWQQFYGEITGMDRAFGKLRNELKKLDSYSNTILWYCSDNGGLPFLGSTGGKGSKGTLWEGGLRVPAILQWPEKYSEPSVVRVPANTSDIFPTLLDLAGIPCDSNLVLDGMSLSPVIEGKTDKRNRPMGFWIYPVHGIRTPSAEWMSELLDSQRSGNLSGDSTRLRLEAGKFTELYPVSPVPGHAAWLDWPWKLHRITGPNGTVYLFLYNLENDSMETADMAESEPDITSSMQTSLEEWLSSVIQSMNWGDYEPIAEDTGYE